MKTKEILSIIAFVLLGVCLFCGISKMTMKNLKSKQICDYAFSLCLFGVVILLGVNQLLKTPSSGPSPGPSPGPAPSSGVTTPADVDVDIFFSPYDCPTTSQTMIDIGMINAVTSAAKASNTKLDPNDSSNLFQIKYSVYNLYDSQYLDALIDAYKAGVFVQVLIHLTEEDASYNKIWSTFKAAGLQVLGSNTQSQRDCTQAQLNTLNLIPIDPKGSLMHCKTRYYKFGGSPQSIQIGDKKKTITEAVVTGSFNPECSATKNNEYLLVLSSNDNSTPKTIEDYLRIYDFVKHELAGTSLTSPMDLTIPAPKDNDPIYNINKALFVCYSGWCKGKYNNVPSYMRYVLANLIDKEQQAIFLPLYSLSNLDAPDKYTKPLEIDASKAVIIPPAKPKSGDKNGPQYFSYTLTAPGLSEALKNVGVDGIGAQMEVDYGSSRINFIIRGPTGDKDSVYLILKSRTQPVGKITKITVYNSILTHFGDAIKRKVMVFLMINKAQADGEVANDGTSFTGGDSMLTAFLIQQMGGTTWRCQNPNGELHSKSGYFYSQNTLITDTTNWSNAGMGYQGKSGPNCSTVNNETCLVIKGNALKDDNAKKIFKTRVLANIINTARMYAYQQTCPVADSTFGGATAVINSNINCECPNPTVSCNRTSTNSLSGICSAPTGESKPSSCYMEIGDACSATKKCDDGSVCYKNKNCVPEKCGGVGADGNATSAACITACCLRYGQTPTTTYWNDICTKIFKLPNWPQVRTRWGSQPLGSVYQKSSKSYIIDPTFDWSKGIRTSDVDLLGYLNGKSLSPGTVKAVTVKSGRPYVPPQGNFCSRAGPCSSKKMEEFLNTRTGVY